MRPLAVLAVAVLVSPAAAAQAPLTPPPPHRIARADPLRLDLAASVLLASGALAASVAIGAGAISDADACRWCDPPAFDRRAREALRWRDTAAAADASDALRLAIPLGSAGAVAWLAAREGSGREALEDVLAVGVAAALTAPLTSAVKHGTARIRPEAWAAGGPRGESDLHSFFSGHTSQVFAAAAAATQVARMRGRPGWRWVAAAAFGLSAGTAWLRVAADQHWASDVLAGAAAGTAMGLAVPPLLLRRGGSVAAVSPGGIAFAF